MDVAERQAAVVFMDDVRRNLPVDDPLEDGFSGHARVLLSSSASIQQQPLNLKLRPGRRFLKSAFAHPYQSVPPSAILVLATRSDDVGPSAARFSSGAAPR
jgi:hypothetical protein